MSDNDQTIDPRIGSAEYRALDPGEQLRICEERAGVFRIGASRTGAFALHGRPYAASDPLANPIDEDNW